MQQLTRYKAREKQRAKMLKKRARSEEIRVAGVTRLRKTLGVNVHPLIRSFSTLLLNPRAV